MKLHQKLRKLRWKILGNPKLRNKSYPSYWFQKVLGEQEIQVVQIGSNDGRIGDPLFILFQKNTAWRSLFVEPVPYIFERLKSNYPDETRFRFENAAINHGEVLDFYWVAPEVKESISDLPFYYDQLGSFHKEHIMDALEGKLTPYIRKTRIQGLKLSELLYKHKIDKIDILHIDTEGYDWKILQQLQLEKYQPQFILFEKTHLTNLEQQAAFLFLEKSYGMFVHKGDVLAVNIHLNKKIMDSIRKNMPAFIVNKPTAA